MGKPDLVLTNSCNHTVKVLLGNGNGTIGPPIVTLLNSPAGALIGPPVVGNFFGDGKLGVAVTTGVGEVSVLRG